MNNNNDTDNDTKKGLMFLIDSTGSMGQWIKALNSSLPLLVRSIALTNVFDDISIMTYRDYDFDEDKICSFSGFYDCSDLDGVDQLQKFSELILANGGGGGPEAWKTALMKIIDINYKGYLYIIHLTDAVPHANNNINREGQKEKIKLGTKFDYVNLYNYFTSQIKNFNYMCLTSSPHPFYCHFAHESNGFVYHLNNAPTSVDIRRSISHMLNTLLGLNNSVMIANYKCIDYQSACVNKEDDLYNLTIHQVPELPLKDPILGNVLLNTIDKMKSSEKFRERVILEFEKIIELDLLALTVSPILGKLWREFCKSRNDPRRDKMISLLKKYKKKLSNDDALVIDEWLTESYNSEMEINDKLCKFMMENEIHGLVRFIPESSTLVSRKIVQLLASTSKKDTQYIRELLARLIIDEKYKYEKINVSSTINDEKVPLHMLPTNSIPLNLPISDFFKLLMHTVAPSTILTTRYAAILSLHIIQCDNILSQYAHIFLEKIKGKWINWTRRTEDNIPKIPECFSTHFLNLILDEKLHFALTEDEIEQAFYYKSVSDLLKFYHNLEINVKVADSTSIDGFYPDHFMNCKACGIDRPLSLIRADGLCGYEPLSWTRSNTSMMIETSASNQNPNKYIQVQCYICKSIYARDAQAIVLGRSKCYNCRTGKSPSPHVRCSVCKYNFVQFYKTNNGLPNDKCGACYHGHKSREFQIIEHHVWAHQVFNDCFPLLCKQLGFDIKKSIMNMPLYNALLWIDKCEPINVAVPQHTVFFREQRVQNVPQLWDHLLKIMSGGEIELPECSVCFESFNPTMLVPACGKKGCSQRVCINCNSNWYGKNKIGCLIYPRATMCQFCCRLPTPKTLEKIDLKLGALAYNKIQLDSTMYYGWCKQCQKPHEIAERSCIRESPILTDYECPNCINKNSLLINTKKCPQCSVLIEKISGCNHIQCTLCNTHWCWECGAKSESSEKTYDHMWLEHGRIFDNVNAQNYHEC